KRPIEALNSLGVSLEVQQRDAALDVRFRLRGQELACALERGEGFAVASQCDERCSSANQIRRTLLTLRGEPVVVAQRFGVLTEQIVHHGAVVKRLWIARLDRKRERIALRGFRK